MTIGKAQDKDSIKGENALYVFNRLLRMATETELSAWKQNQVRAFMKHDQIDEILSLTDSFGRTILDNACTAGNLRLVQLLWPMGAKLGKPHVTMAIVASEEYLPIFDYLLAHDSSLSTTFVVVGQDDDDETERMPLLNFCAKKGDERIVSVLLAYGFKTPESIFKSVDRIGNNPLHCVLTEKVAAQILNRCHLAILAKSNRRGQLPIDSLMERYNAIPFPRRPENVALYEAQLKKTITFINSLMKHVPNEPRTVSPLSLPRNTVGSSFGSNDNLQLPVMNSPSNMIRRISDTSSSSRQLPTRDIPKSFLSRDLLKNAVARNRAAILQEQRERLKSELAAEMQQRMMKLHDHRGMTPMSQHLGLGEMMEAANRVANQQLPSSPSQSPIHTSAIQQIPLNNIPLPTAFCQSKEPSSSGMSPSLSLLASALSKHKKHHNGSSTKSLMMASGLASAEDFRLQMAAHKSFLPQRFEDNELHKLLRAKYT